MWYEKDVIVLNMIREMVVFDVNMFAALDFAGVICDVLGAGVICMYGR